LKIVLQPQTQLVKKFSQTHDKHFAFRIANLSHSNTLFVWAKNLFENYGKLFKTTDATAHTYPLLLYVSLIGFLAINVTSSHAVPLALLLS
jgi:hypothetical protein